MRKNGQSKPSQWLGWSIWLGCSALALSAQAQPAEAGAVTQIQVLQDIPSGLWELRSRTEPAASEEAPEQGCITPQAITRDLQELVETVQSGQICSVQLPVNTASEGKLELRCHRDGKDSLPAVMTFTRPAKDRLHAESQLQMGATGPRMLLVQDYRYLGECNPP